MKILQSFIERSRSSTELREFKGKHTWCIRNWRSWKGCSENDADAAMLEPATIAVHAVRRTEIRLGDSVVVLGAVVDGTVEGLG